MTDCDQCRIEGGLLIVHSGAQPNQRVMRSPKFTVTFEGCTSDLCEEHTKRLVRSLKTRSIHVQFAEIEK